MKNFFYFYVDKIKFLMYNEYIIFRKVTGRAIQSTLFKKGSRTLYRENSKDKKLSL